MHNDEKPFTCDQCTFTSKYSSNLKKHQNLIHKKGGTKSFECDFPQCPYIAHYLSHLISHKKIHDDEKPFKCDFPQCPYESKHLYSLKRHKNIHESKQSYKCNQCTYASNYAFSLKRHQKAMH